MSKAKAKKKKADKPLVVAKEAVTTKAKAGGKTYTFISRDKSTEVKMSAPVKKNKASEVVFQVLGHGELPKGLKLQWADSYSAHFINKKGKNAVGASSATDLLVVNGIARELEAAGVKGIIKPTKKPYEALKLNGWDAKQLADLASKIAMVLGFTKAKKAGVKKEEVLTKEPVTA